MRSASFMFMATEGSVPGPRSGVADCGQAMSIQSELEIHMLPLLSASTPMGRFNWPSSCLYYTNYWSGEKMVTELLCEPVTQALPWISIPIEKGLTSSVDGITRLMALLCRPLG